MLHDIFLSYSRKDLDLMHKARADLEKAGFSVWTDEGIEPGTPLWDEAIEEALEQAGCMVVILTPNAKHAKGLRDEIHYANIHNVRIFPLLVEGDEKSSVPYRLSGTQWVDLRASYDGELARFAAALRKFFDGGPGAHSRAPLQKTPSQDAPAKFSPQEAAKAVLAILPEPFEWREISAGKVILEDASGRGGTKGGEYRVERFDMAKYPVTNAQYEVFVKEGYNDAQWWDYSEEAKEWRKAHPKPRETAFPGDSLPRTNVRWYDAMAFCRWLTARVNDRTRHALSLQIRLPTEQQWQRAAVGDSGWIYPWGNAIDDTYCNYGRKVGQPTPVTQYPKGASPYDVMDMSGNVWEWCLTGWGRDDSNIHDSRTRVLRGGSWDNLFEDNLRAAYRNWFNPFIWGNYVGFRCALS
jgi:formylglycine-generating enzyme required for sulfatase activity